jgi:hypothetical protein
MSVVDNIISSVALDADSAEDTSKDAGAQATQNDQTAQSQSAQTGDQGSQQGSQVTEGQSGKTTVPDDHPTKLGRRVSNMEARMADMLDKFDTLIGKFDNGIPTREAQNSDLGYVPLEDDTPDHVKETVVAVKRELARDAQREQETQQKYAEKYIKAVQGGFGDSDEELHNAVVKELLETNFRNYGKHTGNPARDAQLNYEMATAAILRRQRVGQRPIPNVHGDRQNASTELSSSTRLGEPPLKKVELDEFSRKFLKAVGAKEDDPWVLESLGVKK